MFLLLKSFAKPQKEAWYSRCFISMHWYTLRGDRQGHAIQFYSTAIAQYCLLRLEITNFPNERFCERHVLLKAHAEPIFFYSITKVNILLLVNILFLYFPLLSTLFHQI